MTRIVQVGAAAACVVVLVTLSTQVSSSARPSLLALASAEDLAIPPSIPPLTTDDTPTSTSTVGAPTITLAPTELVEPVEPSGDSVALGAPLPTPRHDPPRIMVVGDSVATTLGKGLEGYGKETGEAIVWPTWRYGCGIARGGQVEFATGFTDLDPACDRWPQVWAGHLDRFDPDVVVVLSGVWDAADRLHPRWPGEVVQVGDPRFDDYLRDEYTAAVDLLASRGATVVWLTAPCVSDDRPAGPLENTHAFDTHRLHHLNTVILPGLLAARPGVVRGIDLFSQLCPGGRYQVSYGAAAVARTDGLHLDHDGSREVARWLLPQLLSAPLAVNEVQPAAAEG